MAGISVKIGEVDKTEYVDARTLSIRDELTSKVNSASFDFICNNIAIAPKPGEAVLIEEGTKKLFSGRILSKEESFLPPNLLKYPVECIDHTRDLDKKLVAESYKNQKAGDIIKDIIYKYSKIGIPTGYNDPDSKWIYEIEAYDDDVKTYAYTEIESLSWGSFLELNIDSILCNKIRFFAGTSISQYITEIDIDVYYDGTWHGVYQGNYTFQTWEEKSLGGNYLVTKARIRFYNSHSGYSQGAYFHEFNFGTSTTNFTTNNISDGPTISEITFDYVQISEAFTKIAEICGYEWYVDYDKDIHFFAKNTYPAPFQLDDNQADYKDLIINTDISQLRNRIFVKTSGLKDTFGEIFIYDGVVTEWTCKFAPVKRGNEKLPDPSPIPSQEVWRCDFSFDDIYLAVPYKHEVSSDKGIIIYKRDNDLFKGLNLPDVTPNDDGMETSFSPDSIYLALAHKSSPYITIYKRDEDTFIKLDDPANLPTGDGYSVNFSPDGVYLAVGYLTPPYLLIYKRAGDIFSKLDNPADLPAGSCYGCKFSPDGVYLAMAHNTSPYITIYKRNGDTFTKLNDPAILPTGAGRNVAWSPDCIYLAVGHDTSPFITIYKREGDIFTKLNNPDELPTGTCYGVDFSPDGIQLAVAHSTTPYISIYTRSGDILGKQTDPADLPSGNGKGVIFSHNSKYLVVGHRSTPHIIIYRRHSPAIKVDGVIKTIGWDGVDNPLYYDFMLNSKTKVLSIGSAGTQIIDIGTLVSGSEKVGYPNFTFVNKSNPANKTGKITRIEIYAYYNLSNCKVATFYRPDPGGFPNNFSTRDTEIIGTVISGSKQVFEVDLDVIEGDYIGIYFTAGYLCAVPPYSGYDGRWYIESDKIPCTNQTFEVPELPGDTVSIYGSGSIGKGELSIGSEIFIGYAVSGVPICFKREDQDSIDIIKALEGGDGIIEFCLVDNNIDSIDWANEAAKADLLKNANSTIKATFITNRSDIRSGQIIILTSTKRDINQQFIVQSVELVRVDVLTEWPTISYKPAAEAKIGYKPASEAEKGYRAAGDSGGFIYYIFNVTIANKFKKLEDLFIYLLNRTDESLK